MERKTLIDGNNILKQSLFSTDSNFIPAFSVLTVSLFYYLSYYRYGFLNGDWGMIVVGAERFLRGEVFYRDFSIIYTPGIYLYTALAFKLFGVSLASATAAWNILRALNCLLIYLIGTEFVPRKIAFLLPLLLWFVPGAVHKSFFVFFILLDILILVRMMSARSSWYYLIAGILVIIIALFRIDLAGFFIISLVVVECWKIVGSGHKIEMQQFKMLVKNMGIFSLGAIFSATPLIFYLLHNSALNEAYYQTVQYSDAMKDIWFDLPPLGQIFTSKFNLYGYLGIIIPFIFYFFIFVTIGLIIFFKDVREEDKKLIILSLFGGMTLNQVIMHPGIGRVVMVLAPVLIADVYLIFRYFDSRRNASYEKYKKYNTATLMVIAVLNLSLLLFIIFSCYVKDLYANGSVFWKFRLKNATLLSDPKLNIYTDSKEAEEFKHIVDVINTSTRNDEYIFTFPNNHQMFHFVTGRKTLEKYGLISEYMNSEKRQKKVIEFLKEKNVRMIIMDISQDRKRKKWALVLDTYIAENFKPIRLIGNYALLGRK